MSGLAGIGQTLPGSANPATSSSAPPKLRKRFSAQVSCSLASGHGPLSSGHNKDKVSGWSNSQRQRVSAVAIDAPAWSKEDEQLKARLSENQARLAKMYFASPFELEQALDEAITDSDDDFESDIMSSIDEEAVNTLLQRHQDSLEASSSSTEIQTNSTGVVPSTRRPRRARRTTTSAKADSSKRNVERAALKGGLERFGETATEYLESIGGSHPDLEYLMDIRAWLQSGRTNRGRYVLMALH